MENPDAQTPFTYTFKPSGSAAAGTSTGLANSSLITTVVDKGGKVASYAHKDYQSKLENKSSGTINLTGDKSIGMGLLNEIQGAYSSGTINIGTSTTLTQTLDGDTESNTALVQNAVGVYTEVAMTPVKAGEVDDFGIYNGTVDIIGSTSVEVSGAVNLKANASASTGLRIKNKGSITLKNGGSVNLETSDNTNYGVVVEGTKFTRTANKTTVAGGTLTQSTENLVGRVDVESGGSINVNSKNSIGFALLTGEGTNAGTISVNSNGSLGFYGEQGSFENSGTIQSTGEGSHAVVLHNTGIGTTPTATQILAFNNTGNITTNTIGTVGIYAENGSTFVHQGSNALITAGNGAIGVYAKDSNTAGTISSEIKVTGSTTGPTGKTGIAVYSDGDSVTTFKNYSPVPPATTPTASSPKLTLGEGTVGLYSADSSKFESTFVINGLEASIGDKAAFAYFGSTGTANITAATLNNLTVSKMGENSTLFYGDSGSIVNIDDNVTTSTLVTGTLSGTAQLLVSSDGTGTIKSGKTVTSGMKTTISGLNNATITNNGTLALTGKDEAVGIYSNNSTVTNNWKMTTANGSSVAIYGKAGSTLTNASTGEIATSGMASVGIFADASTAKNEFGGKITTSGIGSAGIYGQNGSSITNAGEVTASETGSAGIYADNSGVTNESTGKITVEKGTSAGIYAIANTDRTVKNEGTIEVGTSTNFSEAQSIGIYGKSTGGTLTLTNDKDINIHNQK